MIGKMLGFLLIPLTVIVACSDVGTAPASDCVENWTDPTGQSMCPAGATVSCNQATRCFVTLADCQASGECATTNPGTGGTGGTPSMSMCDPNWTDPNGMFQCPQGLPVSCDQASQCWDTVASCEAAGECT